MAVNRHVSLYSLLVSALSRLQTGDISVHSKIHPTSSGCAILFVALEPVVIAPLLPVSAPALLQRKNPWSYSPLNLTQCFYSALSLECLSSVSSQHTWRPRCVKCEGVCVSALCVPAHFLLLRNASSLCHWNNRGERFCFPTCSFIFLRFEIYLMSVGLVHFHLRDSGVCDMSSVWIGIGPKCKAVFFVPHCILNLQKALKLIALLWLSLCQ